MLSLTKTFGMHQHATQHARPKLDEERLKEPAENVRVQRDFSAPTREGRPRPPRSRPLQASIAGGIEAVRRCRFTSCAQGLEPPYRRAHDTYLQLRTNR
jgi:hypothetical protein